MHVDMWGAAPVDDTKVYVSDICRKVGDEFGFVYDLGDSWTFVCKVEAIAPREESTGRVVLLGGEMACPPEDSCGLSGMGNYYEDIAKKVWKDAKVLNAANYETCKLRKWDPYRFDLEEARQRLSDANASQASPLTNTRMEAHSMLPLGRGGGAEALGLGADLSKSGTKYVEKRTGRNSVQTQVIRDGTHKDERNAATCNVCGAPGKFLCSGCDVQRYCSVGC
jgi:hypothetical protein